MPRQSAAILLAVSALLLGAPLAVLAQLPAGGAAPDLSAIPEVIDGISSD
jgi:hypothetical protein